MIALALATGIAPSVWAEEDEQTIVTALDLLDSKGKGKSGDGPQMSG